MVKACTNSTFVILNCSYDSKTCMSVVSPHFQVFIAFVLFFKII